MVHVALILAATFCLSKAEPLSGQYHLQTDEGDNRFFTYQTDNGQFRREKRLADGTVKGTSAWVDLAGFLHQQDYIADKKGFRIVNNKDMFVGVGMPVSNAMKMAKASPNSTPAPLPSPIVEITHNSVASTASSLPEPSSSLTPPTTGPSTPFTLNPWYYSSTPRSDYYPSGPQYEHFDDAQPLASNIHNGPTYPLDANGQLFTGNNLGNGDERHIYPHNGISVTNDGFRYYIPKAYHEEKDLGGEKKGSFGYVDPFGIRRVIYYNAVPGIGFQHRKNNRYVGFNAPPYDEPH